MSIHDEFGMSYTLDLHNLKENWLKQLRNPTQNTHNFPCVNIGLIYRLTEIAGLE